MPIAMLAKANPDSPLPWLGQQLLREPDRAQRLILPGIRAQANIVAFGIRPSLFSPGTRTSRRRGSHNLPHAVLRTSAWIEAT